MTTAIRWLLGSILALPALSIGLNPGHVERFAATRATAALPGRSGTRADPGALEASRPEGRSAAPPLWPAGRVFVGSADGRVYALELASGRRLWSADLGGAVASTPAVSGNTVFVASRNRRLTALDCGKRRGPLALRVRARARPFPWGWDYWVSSPMVAGPRVFVGAGDGGLYALEASTGRRIWRLSTGGRIRSSPAIADGVVYVGSMDGKLYAVDAEVRARRATPSRRRGSRSTPPRRATTATRSPPRRRSLPTASTSARATGTSTASTEAAARGAGASGTGSNSCPALPRSAGSSAPPPLTSGLVLVGSSDGKFFNAVREETGEEVWRFRTPERVFSSGAVAGDTVFFGVRRRTPLRARCEDRRRTLAFFDRRRLDDRVLADRDGGWDRPLRQRRRKAVGAADRAAEERSAHAPRGLLDGAGSLEVVRRQTPRRATTSRARATRFWIRPASCAFCPTPGARGSRRSSWPRIGFRPRRPPAPRTGCFAGISPRAAG